MKKITLILISLILVGSAKAQIKIHVGATTAINSTFVLDKGLKADPRYLSTATYKFAPIGFSSGVVFGKHFGINLEAIKAAQGQVYDVIDAYDKIVGMREFDMSYLQIPLMFQFLSGGDGMARFNFQMGPQLSIIQTGQELIQYAASTQNIPDGVVPPEGAVLNPDGTYDVPAIDRIVMATDDVPIPPSMIDSVFAFKNKEIQLTAAMGVDLDVSKNIYVTALIRANYSFTDMRGQELLDILKSGSLSEILDQRANLAVGIQLGVHWMFGGTRHFMIGN